jgi:hypothetical protein
MRTRIPEVDPMSILQIDRKIPEKLVLFLALDISEALIQLPYRHIVQIPRKYIFV